MKRSGLYYLAALHFVNDFSAGLMGSRALQSGDVLTPFIVYNLLAFGMQPLAVELIKNQSRLPFLPLILAFIGGGGLLLSANSILAASVCLGIASSFFHVWAGAKVMSEFKGSTAIGIFSAPGVLGLGIGGCSGFYAQSSGLNVNWLMLPIILMVAVYLLVGSLRRQLSQKLNTQSYTERKSSGLVHQFAMAAVLLSIALRSGTWDLAQFSGIGNYAVLIYLSLSAFTGKLVGGYVADRLGHRNYIITALAASSAVFSFAGPGNLWFYAGVSLLQSVVPASLSLLYEHRGGLFSAAYGLGFCVFVVMPLAVLAHQLKWNLAYLGAAALVAQVLEPVILYYFSDKKTAEVSA